MASKVKVANYRHVEARYYCIGMLSSSPLPVAPAAVELMPPGGVRPFFPPVPPPLLQYQGNVFPGFQPNFPMIPPSPVPPLMPPPFWGPMMNHHTMTPQFPPSSVWGRPQTNNNKVGRMFRTSKDKSCVQFCSDLESKLRQVQRARLGPVRNRFCLSALRVRRSTSHRRLTALTWQPTSRFVTAIYKV